jgi:hypothetical protein
MNKKYIGIIIALSTFIFWLIISFSDWVISNLGNPLLKTVSASIFSYGFYKIIVIIIKYILGKCEIFKKCFLGNQYLAGKWIGYYIGFNGNVRYIVETIEQDFDDIIIRGNTFDENMCRNSTYTSNAVNIDEKKGEMICTYSASGKNDGDEGIGLIKYTFLRNKRNEKIIKMDAFFTDLKYGKRIASYQEKYPTNDDECELVKKAKELYEKRTNGT